MGRADRCQALGRGHGPAEAPLAPSRPASSHPLRCLQLQVVGARVRRQVDRKSAARYHPSMKRTTLTLNEELLAEATRLSGQRSYSKTVDLALADWVRRAQAKKILELAGSGLWEGNLSEMRGDFPVRRPRAIRVSR